MYSWARDTVMWHWSADTPFWQLSIMIITWMSYQNTDCIRFEHFASKCDISHPLTWVGGGMRLVCHHPFHGWIFSQILLHMVLRCARFARVRARARKLTLLWSLCFRRLVHSVVAPAWCRSANCHDGLSKMMLRLVKKDPKINNTTQRKVF